MKITQIMCENQKIHGPTSMTSGRLQLWSQALEDKSLAQTFHGWVDDSSSLVDDSMIYWYSLIFVDFKATCVVSSDLHWETSNITHMQDDYDILTYKLFMIINFYNFYSHPILHYCQIIIKYLVSEGSYLLGFILKTCRFIKPCYPSVSSQQPAKAVLKVACGGVMMLRWGDVDAGLWGI